MATSPPDPLADSTGRQRLPRRPASSAISPRSHTSDPYTPSAPTTVRDCRVPAGRRPSPPRTDPIDVSKIGRLRPLVARGGLYAGAFFTGYAIGTGIRTAFIDAEDEPEALA